MRKILLATAASLLFATGAWAQTSQPTRPLNNNPPQVNTPAPNSAARQASENPNQICDPIVDPAARARCLSQAQPVTNRAETAPRAGAATTTSPSTAQAPASSVAPSSSCNGISDEVAKTRCLNGGSPQASAAPVRPSTTVTAPAKAKSSTSAAKSTTTKSGSTATTTTRSTTSTAQAPRPSTSTTTTTTTNPSTAQAPRPGSTVDRGPGATGEQNQKPATCDLLPSAAERARCLAQINPSSGTGPNAPTTSASPPANRPVTAPSTSTAPSRP